MEMGTGEGFGLRRRIRSEFWSFTCRFFEDIFCWKIEEKEKEKEKP